MRYQQKIGSSELKQWLKLEVTIGTNDTLIERDANKLSSFIRGMDSTQISAFQAITGINATDSFELKIKNKRTVRLVLMKKFIDAIGIEIIKEARPGVGLNEEDIYLSLIADLIENGKFPDDIFAHHTYRKRGTPTSWVSISNGVTMDEARSKLVDMIQSIINSVSYRMGTLRKLVLIADVNDLTLFILSKPTSAKVVRAEKKNVEVSGASYTIIVLDKEKKRIGVISGSKKEIGAIFSVLKRKVFKDQLAPPRSDVEVDGAEILNKLLQNDTGDSLTLQTLELKKTQLANNPAIKLKVDGIASLDETLANLPDLMTDISIADLKHAEFDFVGYKKIGLYTFGDEWRRIAINTTTKKVTTELELAFIEQVKERLGGIDIKESMLILKDLGVDFIVTKILKDKSVSVEPPIPKEADAVLVDLVKKKIIKKGHIAKQRVCWNCHVKSWEALDCPSCGRDDMRILGENVEIKMNQNGLMKSLMPGIEHEGVTVSLHLRKQRDRHTLPVIEVHNPCKNITINIAYISTRQDIRFIKMLASEGLGTIAILDPKLEGRRGEIESSGSSVVSLDSAVSKIVKEEGQTLIRDAILEQEQQILERVFANSQDSLNTLRSKPQGYNEREFEKDIQNIMKALVPDVVWLGAKHSGSAVPDGYLRYAKKPRRIFGWDAKYSISGEYRLGARDLRKQEGYIDWLQNPSTDPAQLGKLGVYAIIANFDDPKRMTNTIGQLADYSCLRKGARIVLFEDTLLINITEWAIANWQKVIENNSAIANILFSWLRRKQSKKYTVSRAEDWPKLKAKLDALLQPG